MQYLQLRSGNSGPAFVGENNLDTVLWDDTRKAWYVGPSGGGGGAVASVFGRTGVVVAATGDYDGDQIDNVSGVPGASVSDALDYLEANAGAVASVFGRTGVVVATAGDYDASEVGNDSLVPGTFVSNALNNVRDIPSMDVATTGNIALTGTPANIDAGVALVNGVTSVFVWLQTDPKENGPYLYNSGGAWTRLPNWTTSAAFRPAQPFQIAGGTLYGGRTAYLKNASQPTLGVTNIIFNVDLQVASLSQLGQYLFWNPTTNQLEPTGIKSALLADADATIALATASNFILLNQLTANRTVTISNTGATLSRVVSIDVRVVLAFTLTINNAVGQMYTFAAGSRWFGAFNFGGAQWGGPTGVQEGGS